jgi:hypothetical protein
VHQAFNGNDGTGHTELRCLKRDKVDPMKTDGEMGRQSAG